MEKLKNKLFVGLAAFLLAVASWFAGHVGTAKLGGAPGGFAATVASTSQLTVGTTAAQLIATTTNCVSRVLTTSNVAGIYLTLGDETGQTPTLNGLGHYHPTTTQTVYDAATYGCGLWKAISNSAITVTLTEFTSFK